ncbi:MAG: apolipoprotein N-acyltransferase [Paracoccus sp. (in: a-proteobacteria)]|uniref:apolipoprotein N-acyltransferase n=1 Tax=Paracoccus sp. TaxID=267 RepID=UPI0026E00D02|nr:apolipoprotein N-acyltransferase [Paracoccus sp. (in: a-proteobacteria)]MDO5630396.1 apolipoprotein N-acyltransferase [Paracoccus sp. (in: a-proteobacteria)]
MRDPLTPPQIRRRYRPPLRRLAGDAGLGAIAATGLAPLNLWFLALPAIALILWRVARAPTARTVFWQALAAGVGWFALALVWIVEPFLVQPEVYGWMAPFALVLMALGGGLFWAIPAAVAWRLAAPRHASRIAAIAAVLALSDWLRGWIFTGFPWALTGHIWIATPVAQSAAVIGATGLSALTMLLAALPGLLRRPHAEPAARALPGAALCIALTGALWAAGLARLATPLPPDTPVTLRVVQPDAQQALKWDPDWSLEFYRRLLDLSSQPGAPDVVIWPETAVNFLLNDAEAVLPQMAASAGGATLILGIQRAEYPRFFNSLAVIAPDGSVTATYDKFHLVPFGEYIPWGDALARFGITAFAAQQGNGYSPGPGPAVLNLPALPEFQPLICYEAIFPQHLRHGPRPAWLLQITNDAWFGRFSGPYQHLAQARLRTIQSGLPLIRSANTGISAVIDAHGNTRASLPLNQMGKIDAALPAALPATTWWHWGDTPALVLLALILTAASLRRRV